MDLYHAIRKHRMKLTRLELVRAFLFMLRIGMLVLHNGRTTPHNYNLVQETID